MIHEELIKLGFTDTSWIEEGETFTEHTLIVGELKIEVSGIDLVEISKNNTYIQVPNCKTTDDLKALLHLFGMLE